MLSFHKFQHNRRKKKRYIKSFTPKLKIKRFNRTRLPGGIYGAVFSRYLREGKNRGYKDFRDFITDIANQGVNFIKRENADTGVIYDCGIVLQKHDTISRRIAPVNFDLKALPLRELNITCRSNYKIDLYDLISILTIMGWSLFSGNTKYERDTGHEKIYS